MKGHTEINGVAVTIEPIMARNNTVEYTAHIAITMHSYQTDPDVAQAIKRAFDRALDEYVAAAKSRIDAMRSTR